MGCRFSRPQAEVDESLKLFFSHVFEDALLGQQLSVLVCNKAVLGEDVVIFLQQRASAHLKFEKALDNKKTRYK